MTTTVLTVEADADGLWWTLHQLTSASALQADFIAECVALGLADVSGEPVEWRFSSPTRLLIEKAWRLHRDLDVPATALPLVLQLLEEIDYLHTEAAQLRARLRHWEGDR
jgi:MerR HTH family regulatory protein